LSSRKLRSRTKSSRCGKRRARALPAGAGSRLGGPGGGQPEHWNLHLGAGFRRGDIGPFLERGQHVAGAAPRASFVRPPGTAVARFRGAGQQSLRGTGACTKAGVDPDGGPDPASFKPHPPPQRARTGMADYFAFCPASAPRPARARDRLPAIPQAKTSFSRGHWGQVHPRSHLEPSLVEEGKRQRLGSGDPPSRFGEKAARPQSGRTAGMPPRFFVTHFPGRSPTNVGALRDPSASGPPPPRAVPGAPSVRAFVGSDDDLRCHGPKSKL